MVAKLHEFLFKSLLSIGFLALVCMFLFGLTMYLSLHRQESLGFCVSSAVCILAGAVSAVGKFRRAAQKERYRRIWQRIVTDYPKLHHARRWFQLLSSGFCLAGILFSIQVVFWCGGVSAGLAAAELGLYEVGERIFVLVPAWPNYKGDLSLLATWDGEQESERENDRELVVNRTIAKVYGSESSQMAHRYNRLGEKYRCAAVNEWFAGNKVQASDSFRSSLSWYQKALPLYQRLRVPSECLCAFSNIAYCQTKLDYKNEAATAFKDACKLIPFCASDDSVRAALARLALVAIYAGREEEASSLWAQSKETVPMQNQEIFHWEWLYLAGLFVIVSMRGVRKIGLSFIAAIWTRRFQRANGQNLFRHYDSMVTLELARGRVDVANTYSIRLLELAQGETIASKDRTASH